MKPLVSVITPTMNAESTIVRALTSVLEQTYERLNVVVIDGSPNDLTEQAVRSIKDERIRYLRQIPGARGQAAARNQGISAFGSDFITFLDADDFYEPSKVEVQVQFLLDHPEHGATYCDVLYRHRDKPGVFMEGRWPTPSGLIAKDLLASTVININSLMYRRRFCEEGVSFEERVRWPEDWQLYVRLAMHQCSFGHGGGRLVNVELRDESNIPFDQMYELKKNTIDMLVDAASRANDPACVEVAARATRKMRRTYLLACLMAGKRELAHRAMREVFPAGVREAVWGASCLVPGVVLKHGVAFAWKIGRRQHYRALRSVESARSPASGRDSLQKGLK